MTTTLEAPSSPPHDTTTRSARQWRWYVLAGLIFLGLGLFTMARAWAHGPTRSMVTPTTDPSLFVWSLQYAATSLSHFSLPLTTPLLEHPAGYNVVANTTVLGIGVPFAPLTWIGGPLFTLNVVQTLAPVASGLAMVFALRRHRVWWPAAICAAGFYAISPYVLYATAWAWIMTFVLFIPPLFWAGVHELIVVRRRSPIWVGAGLGTLIVWQFFIGLETMTIFVLCAIWMVVAVFIWQLVAEPTQRRAITMNVLVGFGVGAAVALVVLVYPLYWSLKGTDHLGNWVWAPGVFALNVAPLSTLFHPLTIAQGAVNPFGASLNARLPNLAYIGYGIPIVFVAGLVAKVRDARLWLLGAMALFGATTAAGSSFRFSPWHLFIRLPLVHNLLPNRWPVVTAFAAAMAMGFAVDDLRHRIAKQNSALALGVAALALVVAFAPVGLVNLRIGPLAVTDAPLPTWFDHHHGGVLLATPSPMGLNSIALTWEAEAGLPNALVGGLGPQQVLPLPPVQASARRLLQSISYAEPENFGVSPAQVLALRVAANAWGVTDVLAGSPHGTNRNLWGGSPTPPVGLFTEAFGPPTSIGPGWWAWHLTSASRGTIVSLQESTACNAQAGNNPLAVVTCLTTLNG